MRKIDGKYATDGEQIVNVKTGVYIPPDEPLFLIRARDMLAVRIISLYIALAQDMGCGSFSGPTNEFLADLGRTRTRFENWRRQNQYRMKLPD